MPNEEGTVVNDNAVQDTATTDSAPEETQQLEVVSEGPELNPNDFRESETETVDEPAEADVVEETETDKPEVDQELAPKSQNRFQQLANENREMRQQLEALKAKEAQLATEQELVNEINPETGDYYTPQEVERIAFQQARQAQQQQIAQERQALEVQANQQTLSSEASQALQDFPMFDETSKDYNPEIAKQADDILGQNLVIDPQTGQVLGSRVSPYQLYQSFANTYQAAAQVGQLQGQKATEQMLAQTDTPSSAPVTTPGDDKAMSPTEYAKAHGLEKVW